MDIKFVNLTPNTLALVKDKEDTVPIDIFKSEGNIWIALVNTHAPCTIDYKGNIVEVKGNLYRGVVQNLPEPKEGVIYIVTLDVLAELRGIRTDVLGPVYFSNSIKCEDGLP